MAGPLADALEARGASPLRIVTDWGGAHVGVASVAAPSVAAAVAVVEKQLRDQGETDDVAHLLVHQATRRGGKVQLAYTAVSLKLWQHYRALAQGHPAELLWFDPVRLMLGWARQQDCRNGAVVLVRSGGLDLMLLAEGVIVALERVRYLRERDMPWREAALRIGVLMRQHGTSDMTPVLLLAAPGTVAPLADLRDSLAPTPVAGAWGWPDAQPLDWATHVQRLPVWGALNRPLEKVAALAQRAAPWAGAAALALSLLLAVSAAATHWRVAQLRSTYSERSVAAGQIWQDLDRTVKQADRQIQDRKQETEWLQQRLQNSRLPDFHSLLAQIRASLPAGMTIDEVGLVVDKGAHLVTVVGQAGGIDGALRGEAELVEQLEAQGYTVVKRDMVVRDGQQKFKLSMTWSGT